MPGESAAPREIRQDDAELVDRDRTVTRSRWRPLAMRSCSMPSRRRASASTAAQLQTHDVARRLCRARRSRAASSRSRAARGARPQALPRSRDARQPARTSRRAARHAGPPPRRRASRPVAVRPRPGAASSSASSPTTPQTDADDAPPSSSPRAPSSGLSDHRWRCGPARRGTRPTSGTCSAPAGRGSAR